MYHKNVLKILLLSGTVFFATDVLSSAEDSAGAGAGAGVSEVASKSEPLPFLLIAKWPKGEYYGAPMIVDLYYGIHILQRRVYNGPSLTSPTMWGVFQKVDSSKLADVKVNGMSGMSVKKEFEALRERINTEISNTPKIKDAKDEIAAGGPFTDAYALTLKIREMEDDVARKVISSQPQAQHYANSAREMAERPSLIKRKTM